MKCGFCDREFEPAESEQACTACPVLGSCHLVRCPYCGYEMPPESLLSKWLRGLKSPVAKTALETSARGEIDPRE